MALPRCALVDLLGTGVFARDGEDNIDSVVLEMPCFGVREADRLAEPSDCRLPLCDPDISLGVGCVAGSGAADFSGVPHAVLVSGFAYFVFRSFALPFEMLRLLAIVAVD
jgi:hypothetical protein